MNRRSTHACMQRALSASCFPPFSLFLGGLEMKKSHYKDTQDTEKLCPSFPLFQLRHYVLSSQQKSKAFRGENR